MAAKKIIGQKFGGTSVATPESRQLVIKHIQRTLSEGYHPVVVVSAMGRRGAPYATDTLLDLIRTHGEPVDGRDDDLIFHCGEIVSAALISHMLKQAGLKSVALTGSQACVYSDGRYRRAKIVEIDPARLLQHVERGEIPVVTGGQGATKDTHEVNILGRGASDTSGVAVAVAVGAEKAEIYTDVPGVAIADPRVVPAARFLKQISYRKMYEIGVYGARVMHPGAVLIGQRGNTPVVCRSTFIEGPGTVIADVEDEGPLVGIPSLGGVDLLTVPGGARWKMSMEEIFDHFAAVSMHGEDGDAVVAVAPDWRGDVEDALKADGLSVGSMESEKAVVSLVGSPDFIADTYPKVRAMLAEMAVPLAFSEQADIRSSFAVPDGEAWRVVAALYEAFVA